MKPQTDKKLLLVIGPPGGGKTTFQKSLSGYVLFDLDDNIRALMGGTLKYYPDVVRVAKTMMETGFLRAVESGVNICVAVFGTTVRERSRWTNPAVDMGYDVEICVRTAPVDELVTRCKNDKSRPATARYRPIIENWFKNYEPPE